MKTENEILNEIENTLKEYSVLLKNGDLTRTKKLQLTARREALLWVLKGGNND